MVNRILAVLVNLFLLGNVVSTYSIVFAANDAELMQQGKVRTCLKAAWSTGGEHDKGSKLVRGVILTGRCEAPTGCDCMLYQHPNGAVASEDVGEEFCSETAFFDSPEKTKKLAQVLGVSTQLLAKWAPKKPMSQAEIDERNRQLRNRCNKARHEASDPVLQSVPVGARKCKIIKNNLASAGTGNSNVLGLTADGKIPYGNVDIVVQEETYKHAPIEFSAVGTNDPVETNSGGENNAAGAGGHSTLKNALLSFLSGETTATVKDLAKNCAGISWDPYGRVFDSQTLEPIPDVIVELIDENTKQPVQMTYNLNYDFTGDDGLYNIQVEKEGVYSLTVNSLTTHTFVQNPKLHPNWKYIYSDLYYPGDIFAESQNVPTHHDIPLFLEGEPYRDAVAKIVPGTLKSEDMNGVMIYTGRSTYPMAQTCLINEQTGEKVGDCVNANNIGSFTIAIPKSEVPNTRLRVSVQKVDLTNAALFDTTGEVQTLHMNSLMLPEDQAPYYFDPVLSMVEGYAQDAAGNRIGEAVVQVKLKANKQVFFETKADALGLFTLYAPNLPTLEYYLEFIDPKTDKSAVQSTAEFVAANKEYLDEKKLNLVLALKDEQPVEIKKVEGKLGTNLSSGGTQNQPTPVQIQSKPSVDPRVAIVGVILIALVGIGIAAAVLIKRQNKA